MDPEDASVAEFDPESPLAKFITGVAQIFYRDTPAGETDPQRLPEQLKAEVERLILDVVPAPTQISVKSPEQLSEETVIAAWEALEAGKPQAEDLALAALRYSPRCADAYTLLGISAGGELQIALPMFTLAVMAGADSLGPDGFERYAGRFWEAPETRPFMVALGFLARANKEAGALDAAANHLAEMLNLNPTDEQGARYDLLAIALQTGMTDIAGKLIQAYADDEGTFFAWAKALFAFQRSGDSDQARLALRQATTLNRHVAEFLTGSGEVPEEVLDVDEIGGEAEAVLYLDLMGDAWTNTKGAIDWLRKHTVKVVKAPPPKEKRSGPREV